MSRSIEERVLNGTHEEKAELLKAVCSSDFRGTDGQALVLIKAVYDSGFRNDVNLTRMPMHSGFDPFHTLRLLYKIENFDEMEILKLCRVYALKGTNTDELLRTSTDVVLKTLFEKYNVKPRVGNGNRNTITLSRIAACFPHYVCEFCQISKKRVIPVDLDRLPLSYPKAMTIQVFASLIPTSDESLATMLLNAHLYYLVKFDVINKESSSWDKVVKYQKAAYQSEILTEEEKIKYCLALKVLYKDDHGRLELMPEVALAAFQIADLRRRPTIPDGYFLSHWHESFLRMGLSVSFLEDLYEKYGYSLDDVQEGKDKENAGTTDGSRRPRSSSADTSAETLSATESSRTSGGGEGSEAASTPGQDQDDKARYKKATSVRSRLRAEEEEK